MTPMKILQLLVDAAITVLLVWCVLWLAGVVLLRAVGL